jgi:glycosyltransferase involved in cell wall biosynthesis
MRASVIIANYNYGRFLRQCIDSVRAQTYPHVEIIVVDDGSTDDSRAVLESYGSAVVGVYQQNAGQAAALSAGFARSSGELICLLDADDGWYPHKLERIVATFAAQPQAQWVRHKIELVDEQLQPLHSVMPPFRGSAPVPGDPVLFLETGLRAGTTLVMRRALAERVFPVVITPELALDADDTVLFAHVFRQRAPGYSLDEVLGFYRRHAGTRFTAQDMPRLLQREAALADALSGYLGFTPRSPGYKLRVALAALAGQPRTPDYLAGLNALLSLWHRPKLLARQFAALSYAYVAPQRWVRRISAIGADQ